MKLRICSFLLFLMWLSPTAWGQPSQNSDFFHYSQFNINNISAYVRNNGELHRNPLTGNAGFEWPRGSGMHAVYSSGIWLAAKVGGAPRVAANEYSFSFRPGPIDALTHEPLNPNNSMFRVYRLHAGDSTSWDYHHWPSAWGAPIKPNRKPLLLGEQTLWCVYNDADTADGGPFQSQSLGIEVQQTVCGYNSLGEPFSNLMLVRFLLLNKGINTLDSMHFAFWSDPDLGGISDDRDGCDSALSLWYCYNASDYDVIYGQHPPSVGYITLQGPRISAGPMDSALYMGRWVYGFRNLPLTTFVSWSNSSSNNGNPYSATEVLYYMSGRWRNGQPITYGGEGIDPRAPPVRFMYSGDPETGVGWLSTNSRHEFGSSGPFQMAPGDTQEVVIGILMSRDSSNTRSVTKLRREANILLGAYRDSLHTFFVPAHPHIPPSERPFQYELFQNYPNPFNLGTQIQFDLPVDDEVNLEVYNMLGQRIATLASGVYGAGTHMVRWEPGFVATGVYVYRLKAARYVANRRMVIQK